MNSLETYKFEYEYSESVEDFLALKALIRKRKLKKQGDV